MRWHTGRTAAILSGLLAAGLVACTQSPSAGSRLAGTSWVLATVEGAPVAVGIGASLSFGAARDASGFGGCNQFTTSYTTDGASSLSFGPIASTKMACEPATSLFETRYFAALAKVARYSMSADALTLSTSTGAAVLTYGAAAAGTVEGPWNVTMVNNGQGAVVSVPTGVSAAMSFTADGQIDGFGGCNTFNGTYTVAGAAITIGPLMATQKACDQSTNTFEAQFFAALEASKKWSVTNGSLDLRDAGGAQQIAAVSAIGH